MKTIVIAACIVAIVLVVVVFASNIWLELTRNKRRQERIDRERRRRDAGKGTGE